MSRPPRERILPGAVRPLRRAKTRKRAKHGRAVMALAPRRRARRLWGYWRSEQRTLRQGFVALMVSTAAALVAGITLGTIRDTLILLPSPVSYTHLTLPTILRV